jgi:hypothetical protein
MIAIPVPNTIHSTFEGVILDIIQAGASTPRAIAHPIGGYMDKKSTAYLLGIKLPTTKRTIRRNSSVKSWIIMLNAIMKRGSPFR